MKVELTSEAVDGLMRSILLNDYKSLCSDIKRLEDMDNRSDYQTKDLENNIEYRAAMEKMMEYYIGYHWESEL